MGTRAISARVNERKGVIYMRNRIKKSILLDWHHRCRFDGNGSQCRDFTTWQAVADALTELIKNPYLLGSVAIAVLESLWILPAAD